MYYQQGDVLLIATEMPRGAKLKQCGGHLVLAEGEATGHAHAIVDTECQLYSLADELFIKCEKPVTVTHEEHAAIEVPAGTWRVAIVREYDHFAEESRQVMD